MKRFTKIAALFICVLMMVSLFAACNKEEATTTTAATTTAATTTAAEVKEDDKYGGQMVFVLTGGPSSLNYFATADNPGYEMCHNWIHRPLVVADSRVEGGYAPELAESWSYNEDQTVWTFNIRKDVYWHDGVQFTAHDVVFTEEYLAQEDILYGVYFIDPWGGKYEALDDFTLQITYDAPNSSVLGQLDMNNRPMPKHIFENVAPADYLTCEFASNPIGCGPFKFVEYKTDEYMLLEANEEYWAGRPYLDSLYVQFVPEATTQLSGLEAGDIDLIRPGAQYYGDVSAMENVNAYTIDCCGCNGLYFNHADGKLMSDKNLRQALEYLIQREIVVENMMNGVAYPAQSVFAPKVEGHTDDVAKYEYSIEKAKECIEKSGYTMGSDGYYQKDGQRLTIEYSHTGGSGSTFEQIGLLIQQSAKQAGIDFPVVNYDRNIWQEKFNAGDWDLPLLRL